MPTTAYINQIATGVPRHDVHAMFVQFARTCLEEPRSRAVFDRLAKNAHIEHRFSVLSAGPIPDDRDVVEAGRFYTRDAFPSTGERMALYEKYAPELAVATVAKLGLDAKQAARITHVIVTSCTGFYAPGLDFDLVDRCGLSPAVERTIVGFMGCYAAINALRLAHHIVRSAPESRVLIVNLELCSLHMQQTNQIESMLSFLVFGDGCAASVVSADPTGFAIEQFETARVPNTRELITWNVRDSGFTMFLSGQVPSAIQRGLEHLAEKNHVLAAEAREAIELWAIHPGGRTVLDAVEKGLVLAPDALAASRDILRRFGNMSSATVMFVLEALQRRATSGQRGCAMSFGPGLTAETMLFRSV